EWAATLAARAAQCGRRAGGLSEISAAMAEVEAGLLTGAPATSAVLERLGPLADGLLGSDLAEAHHVLNLVVLAEFVLESGARAERLLEVIVGHARDPGHPFLLAFTLAVQGELLWRQGRWSEALVTVTTDVWETPLGLAGVGAWLTAVRCRVEAGVGLDA